MKVYLFCNPKYEEERFRFLQRHFPAHGIPWDSVTIVHGPWGSELTSQEYFQIYDPFQERFGNPRTLTFKTTCLSKGEVSLLYAFQKFLTLALEQKDEYVLLFESDIQLRPDFQKRLESVLEGVKDQEWDMISLSEGVGTRPPGMEGRSYFAPQLVVPSPHWMMFRCCDATLFHRRFLEKLQKTCFPARECLDWWLNVQALLHRGRGLWVDPPLAEQGSNRLRCPSNLPA